MNKKILIYLAVTLLMVTVVLAADPTKESDWKDLFGSLGSIGFYFSTIINWIQYIGFIFFYIISVILFFLIVAFLIFWLPLKLYPTFIQYYNFFQRIFKLT
ncbi:hypothetical protein LCGC14_0363250 [marine sediment metagenome]|uniref:Uncharacterized protein n=1 Tax=marine sediment metagenome TaxID=412755 RepID=A0A0F9TD48_9ZZZZ